MQWAKSAAVRWSVTFTSRQERCASRKTNKLAVPRSDQLGLGVMNIDQIAHAVGEVGCGSLVGDLHLAPGAMRVEKDEQIGRAEIGSARPGGNEHRPDRACSGRSRLRFAGR